MKFSLRAAAERMARGRSLWRRLPDDFGRLPLKVSPDALLQLLKPGRKAFDAMLMRLANDYVGKHSVVWDIGANIGVFSLAAAARGGKVLAVEPDPWLDKLLRETQAHRENRGLTFDVLCAAVAARPGTARLIIARRGRASNFLEQFGGRSQAGGSRSTQLVPVLTLDCLLQTHEKPSLIKIDVEGAEEAVLQGATEVLAQSRPIIHIEVDHVSRRKVIARLQGAGYRLHDYETGQECDVDSQAGANLIARPA